MQRVNQTPRGHSVLASTDETAATIGDRLAAWLELHCLSSLAVILVITVFAAWAGSHIKALWFDEIFSVIVSRTTNWSDMKLAMSVDGNPPLLACLIKLSTHLFGTSDFAVRLPSLLGFAGALAGVFSFVRRETNGFIALLATSLVLAEPGWTYAFEARPYALLLGFMMLGLVSWQSATRPGSNRLLGLVGIWLAFVLSMLSHGLGLVEVGLPLVFGEVARSRRLHRIDWPVWIAGAASLPILIFTYPLTKRTNDLLMALQRENVYPLTRASFMGAWVHQPLGSLFLLLSASLVTVMLLTLFLYSRPSALKRAALEPAVWAAIGAALLIPMTYLIMTSTSGYYNCRYGIGSIAGIAILFSLLYSWTSRAGKVIPVLLVTFTLGHFTLSALRQAKQPKAERPGISEIAMKTGLPYVVANPFMIMPHWYYATEPEHARTVYLRDRPDAIHHHHSIVDVCVATIDKLEGIQVATAEDFLPKHREFVLEDDASPSDLAMTSLLKANGYTLQALPKTQGLFRATREGEEPMGAIKPSPSPEIAADPSAK